MLVFYFERDNNEIPPHPNASETGIPDLQIQLWFTGRWARWVRFPCTSATFLMTEELRGNPGILAACGIANDNQQDLPGKAPLNH
jgi:hypothetical protein